MEARCQCGAVQFTTPLPKPLALYICHCDACRYQSGSAFGTSAIFPRFELPQTKMLSCYTRPTHSGHTLYCYFCQRCGTRLIHTTPGKNVVSVKGGCLRNLDWGTAIHIWTRSAMLPIPEGAESYSEEPTTTASEEGGSDGSSIYQPTTISSTSDTHVEEGCEGGGDFESTGAAGLVTLQGPIKGACELSGDCD